MPRRSSAWWNACCCSPPERISPTGQLDPLTVARDPTVARNAEPRGRTAPLDPPFAKLPAYEHRTSTVASAGPYRRMPPPRGHGTADERGTRQRLALGVQPQIAG